MAAVTGVITCCCCYAVECSICSDKWELMDGLSKNEMGVWDFVNR